MGLMHDLKQDVGYALRLLAKNPAFALASVLTLALGIGANVAVFSVVYGVLLRPLPYRDAGQLLLVSGEVDLAGASRPVPTSVQPGQFDDWHTSFDAIAPPAFYSISGQALSGETGSEVVDSAVVSGTFFSTLSGPLAAGRALEPADDSSPTVVVSDRLARRLFRDAAGAVGRQLTLSSRAFSFRARAPTSGCRRDSRARSIPGAADSKSLRGSTRARPSSMRARPPAPSLNGSRARPVPAEIRSGRASLVSPTTSSPRSARRSSSCLRRW